MALFDKILKKKEKPAKEPPKEQPNEIKKYYKPIIREADNPKVEELIQKEAKLHKKLWNKEYYGSEESKKEFKELKSEINTLLEENPKEYVVRGAKVCGMLMEYTNRVPKEELDIIELLGKGSYYEEIEDYQKAIEIYKEADKLAGVVMKEEIAQLTKEHGKGDYLYQAKARQRINICESTIKRNEIQELEAEAKALEETNPAEAIELYNKLNEINPNVKKYNKRIEILEKRL